MGTRLRPLTDTWPKPLLALNGKPVITYAFDHLIEAGIERFIVNTHHCPERYEEVFPDHCYRERPIHFRHEPSLLDTGGGIKNIEDLLEPDQPLLVYNGDIITTLPLDSLIQHHFRKRPEATLALRSHKPELVALDDCNQVTDIRNQHQTNASRQYCFSGVYLIEPVFLDRFVPGEVKSVIPVFNQMIQSGENPHGVLLDEGYWSDIGTPESFAETETDLKSMP